MAEQETIEIVDGSNNDAEINPALEDNPNIFGGDDVSESEKESADKKEDDNEDDDIEDIELDDLDDDEDEDNDNEDEDDADKEDSDEPDEQEKIEIEKNISKSQIELQSIKKKFDKIIKKSESFKKPEEPKPDQYGDIDEAEQRKYEIRLATWESKKEDLVSEHESLKEELREEAKRQEVEFRKAHTNKDVENFEAYLKKKDYLYYAYINGDESLSDLYADYQRRQGKVEKDIDSINRLKKTGGKIKKIDTTTKGVSSTGGNGIPSKYKYANLPTFKSMVKDMQKRKYDLSGKRFTNERIEKLCKQEYSALKGIPLV